MKNIFSDISQKILLVLFGLVIMLASGEILLRCSGGMITYFQERRNRSSMESRSDYRILCLGESTTARGGRDSWPAQLEDILNERSDGGSRSFAVFNKGREGVISSFIFSELEKNIERYQPHMVIAMMGINDDPGFVLRGFSEPETASGFWANLRILKLFKIASQRLAVLVHGKEDTVSSGAPAIVGQDAAAHNVSAAGQELPSSKLVEVRRIIDRARDFREVQDNTNARVLYERAREIEPDNIAVLTELSYVYLDTGEYERAEKIYRRLIVMVPELMHGHFGLGNLFMKLGRYGEAIEHLLKSTECEPSNGANYIGLIHCYAQLGDFDNADRFFKLGIENAPSDGGIYIEYCDSSVAVRDDASQKLDIFLKAIENCQDNFELYSYTGELCMKGEGVRDYAMAEKMFLRAMELAPLNDHFPFVGLAELYRRWEKPEKLRAHIMRICSIVDEYAGKSPEYDAQIDRLIGCVLSYFRETGDKEKVDYYSGKAKALRSKYCKAMTRVNYLQIYDLLSSRGIKLVCVQYPMRDVREVKEIFAPQERGRILFVDNEKSFVDAVNASDYEEYFTDNFAGDFGHATKKGNRLIARNIADVLTGSGVFER